MTDESRTDETDTAASATLDEQGTTDAAMEAAEKEAKKLVQTVELKDVGPCKKYIKVSVDRASVDERLNEQYSKLVVDSNVAGFRPGKAPRKLVERRFQKDVEDQVKAELLLASLEQLAEEHDIAPLSAPNLDPMKIELPKDGPFVYEFEVEVRPEFDVPNYKGLKIRRPTRVFTDDDVVVEERRLLAPYGQVIPKPEGNAQIGDVVVADVTSKDGDRVLSEMKEVPVRIDPRLAFKDGVAPRFGKQIQGANAGDKRVVDVKLSDSVADASLSGKTVQAHFVVKEVKTLRLPELNHQFLHNFGVHTPEQLHELIHVLLRRRLEYQQRQKAREQVLEQIAGTTNWDLPRDLLIRQARKSLARKAMEMRSDGIAEKEIESRVRLMQQDILNSTAMALKEHFVLQKIAELEKIDIDEDDLEDEIERIAEQNDESPRKVRARMEKEELMDALAAEIIERKALDLILDSAEYEDHPLEQDEGAVGEVEQQTVPGEMKDLTAELPPAEEEKPAPEAG
jgi:trigger factor